MNCDFCGREEAMPFICNYCGGAYCPDHRLPEAHACKGDLTQKRTISAPPQTTFSWQQPVTSQPIYVAGKAFSAIEVRDIIIAWVGLGVAFFVSFSVQTYGIDNLSREIINRPSEVLSILLIAFSTIGSGFVLHELSHKFTAQRYGYWAEFRMWPFGLILALATAFIGFIFAAPGATYISGANISESENGRISLAGPLTNVGVAAFFFLIFLGGTGFWANLGFLGAYFNVFLALFNMLPIGPLDGAKVFRWGKLRWASFFVPLALVFLYIRML